MAAIFQTSQYMREVLEFPELKSYERENNLSELWRAASIKIRPYKAELAERCFFKGLYWTDNNRFSNEELIAYNLKIKDIGSEISAAIKKIDKK